MVARLLASATRVAGEQQQRGRWQRGWRANNSDKGSGDGGGDSNVDMWALATVTRLVGNEMGRGKGSKGKFDGDEGGGH
jgi:hypothetical protein